MLLFFAFSSPQVFLCMAQSLHGPVLPLFSLGSRFCHLHLISLMPFVSIIFGKAARLLRVLTLDARVLVSVCTGVQPWSGFLLELLDLRFSMSEA